MSALSRQTRSSDCPDVDFPVFDSKEWLSSGHLPLTWEVIGSVRSRVSNKVSSNEAAEIVSKIIIDHWTARNVYTKTKKPN